MNRKNITITALVSAAAIVGFGAPAAATAGYPPAGYPPVDTTATTLPVDPNVLLPTTGSDGNGTMILIAASLLGAGGVMTVASRSRRTA